MTEKKEGQIPFEGLVGIDLVTNLDTGGQTLRRRRTGRPAGATKAPAPTKQWWERMGLPTFNNAAEGWRRGQSAIMAETFGHNAEFGGPQMDRAETEESLRKAFRTALRSRITAADVIGMMRIESLNMETRLGTAADWVPAFVDSAIDTLAGVYKLNSTNTEALKRFAHQRRLPQFS